MKDSVRVSWENFGMADPIGSIGTTNDSAICAKYLTVGRGDACAGHNRASGSPISSVKVWLSDFKENLGLAVPIGSVK